MDDQEGSPHPAVVSEEMVSSAELDEDLPKLPPEVWARILEHLPLGTVMPFAAASKQMLYSVLPFVKSLHIERTAHLDVRVANLFRDVRHVYIYSLLDKRKSQNVDHRTVMSSVPFLCRFSQLESVFFGTITQNGSFQLGTDGAFRWDVRQSPTSMKHLVDAISGAYISGSFHQNVEVFGIECPHFSYRRQNSPDCKFCRSLCNNFPIQHVLNFGNCCVPTAAVIGGISHRPGGQDFLQSESRLLQLLGQGKRMECKIDACSWTYYAAIYSTEQLDEMGRLIHSFVGITNLSAQKVSSAIMRSFFQSGRKPPRHLCYLSEASFHHLVKKLGLPVEEDFLEPYAPRIDYLHHLVRRVMGPNVMLQEHSTRSIITLTAGEDPPIQPVVDTGVLQRFVEMLQRSNYPIIQYVAAGVFVNVAWRLADPVVEAGAVPHLVHLMGSRDRDASEHALWAIANIAGGSQADHLSSCRECAMQPLLQMLEHPLSLRVSTAQYASRALRNLCRLGFPCSMTTKAVGTTIHRILAIHRDEDVLFYACNSLYYMSENALDALFDADTCQHLVGLILHKSSQVQLAALQALASIVSKDLPITKSIIKCKALPSLLTLLIDGCEAIKGNVCWVVSSFANAGTEQIHALIDANFINPLIQVLTNAETEDFRLKVSNSIVKLIKQGSQEQKADLAEQGCLQPLCSLLQHEDPEIMTKFAAVTLDGLEHICRALQFYSRATWMGVLHTIVDAGTCQYLVGLLSNSLPQNQVLAKNFLQYIISNAASRTQHFINGIILQNQQKEHGRLSLFRQLANGKGEYLQLVCGVITAMIVSDKNLIQPLIDNGYIVPLVKAVKEIQIFGPQNCATDAIVKILQHGTIQQVSSLVIQGCLGPFCDELLINNHHVTCPCTSLGILWTACSRLEFSSCNGQSVAIAALSETDLCHRLVQLLSHSCVQVTSGAVYIMQWIVNKNPSLAECIVNCSSPESTLIDPLINGCNDSQSFVCSIITSMVTQKKRFVQNFIDANYIAPLIKVLKDAQSEKLIAMATATLSSMIQHGTEEQISFMVGQGCLHPLCNVLGTGNLQVVFSAIDAIEHVINTAFELGNKKLAGLNPLHFCDGIEKVRELQGRFEGIFSDRCKEMLELFNLVDMRTALENHKSFSLRKKRRPGIAYDDFVSVGCNEVEEW